MFLNDASDMFSSYWLPLSLYSGFQENKAKYNAGVKILKPNEKNAQVLLKIFVNREWLGLQKTGGEQDLVNFFLRRYRVPVKTLGASYNAHVDMAACVFDLSHAVLVHFMGGNSKPWQLRSPSAPITHTFPTEEDLIALWWHHARALAEQYPQIMGTLLLSEENQQRISG
eukprot:TRINITY_DN5237_c0_g1_i1.p2 TRINITY_DN5237_c0_g1~~TRINITY_DN5237_c0_g1_i1.p2  ORF type:complete len:170 (+),score=60.93 TRINITY_DN5237_c0_g1_i1:614-1123(+)